MSDFGLKEAIALKHTYVDQTHRFWAYFQLAAAAATGFAWQTKPPTDLVLGGLAVGFAAFAAANYRLVGDAQTAAYTVSEAIDRYLLSPTGQPSEGLLAVANLRKMDRPGLVRGLHAILSVAVIALIVIRMTANDTPVVP